MASVSRTADAVRYVVLHKMASGLRHKMLGELQVIEFTAELCAQMFETGRDPAEIRKELGKVTLQARAAAADFRSMVEWLRPNESSVSAFGDTLDYCLKVVGDEWMLRGIKASVCVSARASAATVSRSTVCELVSTSLLALMDMHDAALDLQLSAELADRQVVLRVEAHPAVRQSLLPSTPVCGDLDWDDVLVLAEARGARCVCEREGDSITLCFAEHVQAIATQHG